MPDLIGWLRISYLLNSNENLKGLINGMAEKSVRNCNSTASSIRDARSQCVEACVRPMMDVGIEVEQFRAEHGVNQFEISTGPLAVVAAVDTLIQSQEILKFQCG